QWRLVQLGLLPKGDVDYSLEGPADRWMETPRLFSEDFVRTLQRGLDAGTVSVDQTADLLGLTADELADLFRSYDVDIPFDL
ncbi:MAG: hypothetical protein ACFE8Z_11615, partial [Candidatus Hermodarchaeota archaeon]